MMSVRKLAYATASRGRCFYKTILATGAAILVLAATALAQNVTCLYTSSGPTPTLCIPFLPRTAQENLISAAEGGDLSRVKALLAGRAKVNDKAAGGTALIAAALGGHLDVVRALLAAKANVNAKADNGDTALIAAADRGNSEIVGALLAAKADASAKAGNGYTANACLRGWPLGDRAGLARGQGRCKRQGGQWLHGPGICRAGAPLGPRGIIAPARCTGISGGR